MLTHKFARVQVCGAAEDWLQQCRQIRKGSSLYRNPQSDTLSTCVRVFTGTSRWISFPAFTGTGRTQLPKCAPSLRGFPVPVNGRALPEPTPARGPQQHRNGVPRKGIGAAFQQSCPHSVQHGLEALHIKDFRVSLTSKKIVPIVQVRDFRTEPKPSG